MVDIRTVRESELADFRRLHNRYTESDDSLATVREWYGANPDLLVGAYRDGELVGICLGLPMDGETVVLRGIAVEGPYRRQGIGTRLLAAFEDRAAALDFRRVSLGSAGGYVDEFYRQNGYSAESILVRLDPADLSEDYRTVGYDVAEAETEDGTTKLYVDVDEFDHAVLEDVRDSFDDDEAIYIVEKDLDLDSR